MTALQIFKQPLVGCAILLARTVTGNNAWGRRPFEQHAADLSKLHICGHIHEAYGMRVVGSTTFLNASVLNERYELVNVPVEVGV